MKNKKGELINFDALRQKAEQKLARKQPVKNTQMTEADTMKLIHELDVYHIELEMQNEELTQAREKARLVIDKYATLYEFAYTGYFSLLPNGKICELNLTAAKMLGIESANIINRNLSEFVTLDFVASFNAFLTKIFQGDSRETIELRLKSKGNIATYVHLEGRVTTEGDKCLIIVVDDSKRKRIEDVLSLKLHENEQCVDLMKVSDLQINELKKEINQLLVKLGEKEKFNLSGPQM
jgi:PAS domain S-box-containing protein